MAEQQRRVGCGCFPLVLVVVVGSALAGLLGEASGEPWIRGLILGSFGLLVLGALFGAAVRRRRTVEEEPARPDYQSPPVPPRPSGGPASTAPPERTSREVRTGVRHLVTEPEDPESRAFKQRLADAVSDLADNVEEMPGPGQRTRHPTSEEMIARAKRRIAEFRDSD